MRSQAEGKTGGVAPLVLARLTINHEEGTSGSKEHSKTAFDSCPGSFYFFYRRFMIFPPERLVKVSMARSAVSSRQHHLSFKCTLPPRDLTFEPI